MRRVLSFFVATILVTCVSAHAADKASKAGEKISVMGKVSATKGKDVDDFTAVKLTAQDGKIYNITIDDKGKDLATKYEGISALVNGTMTKKGDDMWLTVASVGEKKKGKK